MKKEADIRTKENNDCPFGLPITFGCKCAGKCIRRMAPLDIMGKDVSDYEKEMISNANTKLLAYNLLNSSKEPEKCLYASQILENNDAVECNYYDSAPGEDAPSPILTSPVYTKMFNNSIQGLYTVPVGLYSDYNVSKNTYFGAYSLQGSEENLKKHEDVIKFSTNKSK